MTQAAVIGDLRRKFDRGAHATALLAIAGVAGPKRPRGAVKAGRAAAAPKNQGACRQVSAIRERKRAHTAGEAHGAHSAGNADLWGKEILGLQDAQDLKSSTIRLGASSPRAASAVVPKW